jgi:hypothetical protein
VFLFVVKMGGKVLVHIGSAHLPPHLASANASVGAGLVPAQQSAHGGHPVSETPPQCDALFVCVSGWRRAPGFVPRLLEVVRPEVVVPFHWDDFTMPLRAGRDPPRAPFVDVEGFVEQMSRAAPGVQVRRLGVWEEMVC